MGKRSRSARFFGLSSRLLAAASSIAVLTTISSAAAQGNETRRYDIPAQSLSSALFELTKTANLAVIAPPPLLEGKQAPAITGDLSLSDALGQLLTGSGLEFELVGNGRTTGGTLILRQTGAREGAANYIEPSHFQLAQIATDPQRQTGTDGPSDMQLASADLDDGGDGEVIMEEMVVTGTLIRGQAPVGSPLFVINRDEIDRTGFSTTQQLIQSLPQNFGGGGSEDALVGEDAGANVSGASGVNLRGLGVDSTLVLVNGRRMAQGAGESGNFVDISSLPLAAIEQIELLTDGASAVYGSDAIAGVVNFVLRDDYEGAETRLRYGTVTEGNLSEFQASQVFGRSWDGGNILLSYEYYRRDRLKSADRGFAADSDLVPLGGDNFGSPLSSPGNITAPLPAAIPGGQDGTALTPDGLLVGQLNLQNANEGRDLLPEQERHTAFLTAKQDLAEWIEAFGDFRFSRREFNRGQGGQGQSLVVTDSNPFFVTPVPGATSVSIDYNFINDLGPVVGAGDVTTLSGALGANTQIRDAWHVDFYGLYSRESTDSRTENGVNSLRLTEALGVDDPSTPFDPTIDGFFNPFAGASNTPANVLNFIIGSDLNEFAAELWSVNVKADGEIFKLPGGSVKLALGLEYREESFEFRRIDGRNFPTPQPDPSFDVDVSRDIFAAFGELYVPLVGPANRLPGVERLELSVSGRFEEYSDVGTTTNPRVGALWSPAEGLAFRGTYGTSFKAPRLTELTGLRVDLAAPVLNPAGPAPFLIGLLLQGANEDLVPEESRSWTIGAQFTPEAVPGLSFEITYFNIDFDRRIAEPGNPFTFLFDSEFFAPLITLDPDDDIAQAILDGPFFLPLILNPPAAAVEIILDGRTNNISSTDVDGIDFNLSYGILTSIGDFSFSLNGNYLFNFNESVTSSSPVADLVGTLNNPVDFRLRGSASWSNNGWSGSVFVNYSDSYVDNLSDPERGIDAWTTVDLTVSFDTQDRLKKFFLNDVVFSVSALNILDTNPPFANNPEGVGYDAENADPLNRFISLNITKRW